MNYQFITNFTSKNFTRGGVAGRGKPTEIVIHWWGNPANRPGFDGIVNWLCTNNIPTSAHYVVEEGRVACIVDPADVAWHAGNWAVNVRSIGLELNPRASEVDWATAAALIARLRSIYGDLPLRAHSQYAATECPGVYDLARLDSMARGVVLDRREPSTNQPAVTTPAAQQPLSTPINKFVSFDQANVRVAPNDKAGIFAVFPKGTPIAVIGHVAAQDPYRTGDNAWFKTKSGYYVWANAVGNDLSGTPYLGRM